MPKVNLTSMENYETPTWGLAVVAKQV